MFSVSAKGKAGLRLVLDLAAHRDEGFVSLNDVSKRQDLSKKYLEQIVPVYTKAGILLTFRGARGGYKLSKAPEDYTIGDILRLTEGSFLPEAYMEDSSEKQTLLEECMNENIWKGLYNEIGKYLDGISLKDVLEKYDESIGYNYVI